MKKKVKPIDMNMSEIKSLPKNTNNNTGVLIIIETKRVFTFRLQILDCLLPDIEVIHIKYPTLHNRLLIAKRIILNIKSF